MPGDGTTTVCLVKLKTDYLEFPYSDPPLGILYVASSLMDHGIESILFDMEWEKIIPEADIYGISATTMEYKLACQVAKDIKNKYPGKKVVLGGPHATIFQDKIDKDLFDVCFAGEGEDFYRVVEMLEQDIPFFVYRASIQENISTFTPARELLNKELYFHGNFPTIVRGNLLGTGNSATVITSRGCPYKCSFCSSPRIWGRKVRFRRSIDVLYEIDTLIEDYDVRFLRFQDDNMTLNKVFLKELCIGLAKRNIIWRCSTRTNLVDEELLTVLWNGGCREIGFGIESAENRVLDIMNKDLDSEIQRRGIILAKNCGFMVRAFIMTGLPGETKKSGDAMIKFLKETNPNTVTMCTFMPIPGSDVYENPEKYDGTILIHDVEKMDIALKYEKGSPFGFKPNGLSIEEMEMNREKLKYYIFNRKLSNVFEYNKKGYPKEYLKNVQSHRRDELPGSMGG